MPLAGEGSRLLKKTCPEKKSRTRFFIFPLVSEDSSADDFVMGKISSPLAIFPFGG